MTTTSTALPLSDPRTRGLHLGRSMGMGLLRFAVLLWADDLYVSTVSPAADPVGTGLTAMVLTLTLVGSWAIVDGWRRPLRTGAAAWLLAGALLTVLGPLPNTLSRPARQGGWTSLADYLSSTADGAGFQLGLVLVPAAAGLALGHLVRASLRRPAA